MKQPVRGNCTYCKEREFIIEEEPGRSIIHACCGDVLKPAIEATFVGLHTTALPNYYCNVVNKNNICFQWKPKNLTSRLLAFWQDI